MVRIHVFGIDILRVARNEERRHGSKYVVERVHSGNEIVVNAGVVLLPLLLMLLGVMGTVAIVLEPALAVAMVMAMVMIVVVAMVVAVAVVVWAAVWVVVGV